MEFSIEFDAAFTDFMRYHVLIRVFQGNILYWLRVLDDTDRGDTDDARFLRWLHDRVTDEPRLLDGIRASVEASGLWPADA